MDIDISWIHWVLVVILPIVTRAVTQEVHSGRVRALVLAALSAVTVIGQYMVDVGEIAVTGDVIQDALTVFVFAVAAYFGFLKPTGVTDAVGEKTRNFGI